MTKHENWALVYETLYQLDATTEYGTIMPLVKDPLLFMNRVLLRDDELDHRCCLMVKLYFESFAQILKLLGLRPYAWVFHYQNHPTCTTYYASHVDMQN